MQTQAFACTASTASRVGARARVRAAAPLSTRASRLACAPCRTARLVTRAGAVQKVTKDELEVAMQVRVSPSNDPSGRQSVPSRN
jgi:hypothetical protein